LTRSGTSRMVNVAVVAGPWILVLRRAETDSLPGCWEIPGGGVESGESFEEAARRELAEETGIEGANLREILHRTGPAPPGFRKSRLENACFLHAVRSKPPVRVDLTEHSAYRWVRGDELATLRMMELNRSLARQALVRADHG
jgi:8-oxo-dGTP diphosphatase